MNTYLHVHTETQKPKQTDRQIHTILRLTCVRALKSVKKSDKDTFKYMAVTTLPYSIGGIPIPAKRPVFVRVDVLICVHV